MGFRRRVIRFFFEPTSPVPLGAVRIGTGVVTVAFALGLLWDSTPLLDYLREPATGEILWWQAFPEMSAVGVRAMCVGLVVSGLALSVGFCSRLAAWLCFLLTLIIQRYNPSAFNGGDWILRGVLQLGVAIGPSGSTLSIDALRRPQVTSIEPFALRFIQLHVSLGYMLTVYLKLRGHSWLDGTALRDGLNLTDLARFQPPAWMTSPPVGAVLTWSALATEAFVGLGVWNRRLRPIALGAGALLHLGIAITLEISLFSIVMLVTYLAFFPASAFKHWFEPVRSQLRPGQRQRSGGGDLRPEPDRVLGGTG